MKIGRLIRTYMDNTGDSLALLIISMTNTFTQDTDREWQGAFSKELRQNQLIKQQEKTKKIRQNAHK